MGKLYGVWMEWIGGDAEAGGPMSGQSHWLFMNSRVWTTDYAGLAIAQAQATQGGHIDALSTSRGKWQAVPAIIGPDGLPQMLEATGKGYLETLAEGA